MIIDNLIKLNKVILKNTSQIDNIEPLLTFLCVITHDAILKNIRCWDGSNSQYIFSTLSIKVRG